MGNDFVSEEPVEVDVDGRKFKVRELLGEESDKIANEYVKVDVRNDSAQLDVALRNKLVLEAAVVDAPYTGENNKPFKELGKDERVKILNKLKPGIRSALLKKVFEVNSVERDVAKN